MYPINLYLSKNILCSLNNVLDAAAAAEAHTHIYNSCVLFRAAKSK